MTGNLTTDGVGDTLKAHTRNRIVEITVAKPDDTQWLEWAVNSDIEPIVMAWVRQFPQALASYTEGNQDENPYIYNPRKQQTSYVSPRSLATASNIVSALQGMYRAIPVEIIDNEDLHIFVGHDVYRLAVLAYQALNLYNYQVDGAADRMFVIPGTNVKLVAVNGLNGTGDMYATTLSNIALAFDLEAEEDNYSIWYSKDNNEMRYRVAFKLGVNVAYTTLCVKFKSAI